MNKKIIKEKNSFYLQDMTNKDNKFQYNIYRYFYFLFHEKKESKLFIKIIQIIFETIQLISYAFSPNHYNSWKLDEKVIKTVSNILGGFRISPLLHYLKYKIYIIIFTVLISIIFIFCLIILLNIIFIQSSSILYRYSSIIIHSIVEVLLLIFYIPITEIILFPIKCIDGKVYGIKDGEECWVLLHYIHFALGIAGAILFFIINIFILYFNFYPFHNSMSTIRINSTNDTIVLFLKLFLILQYILISNEYISLSILLIFSFIMITLGLYKMNYNNIKLEISIHARNLMIAWTYFILLISKLFKENLANGFIYCLLFGYPIIIYLSIVLYKEKDFNIVKISSNSKKLNDYIEKAKFNIKLINSFIERNQNIRNENNIEYQRNIFLLRGSITIHNQICSEKDCPLTKFISNEGNFNIQKQCLLNYMNNFLNMGLKLYPNNIELLLLLIYFNYTKRSNLNSVRSSLFQLRNMECGFKDKYIIYCMEQNIKKMNIGIDFSLEYEQNQNNKSDVTEQKYQKLKYLIDNSIKLYSEFWGIFSTNISSNINTTKLYILGEKLNIYLNEMNHLWDNELKNKKIGNESQNIVQLYSKFLLEVLWDQKKSKEVYKKLSEENQNNYYQNEKKQISEINNINCNSLEYLTDNQDYLLFIESDEKGNCKIIQCSSSFAFFLNYQKKDLIGKSLKKIFPNILYEEHHKYLENCINSNLGKINQNEQENNSNTNLDLIIIKNRMGYVLPIYHSFSFLNNNDYSNSFLIKTQFENKELKSEYSYFILTNLEFEIENISSGTINLGLSLDLLKNYVLKLNILIRTEDDKVLNLDDKFDQFMEEPKIITWVFPDIIYPKDNANQRKKEEIENLIYKSEKKKYNLQIKEIKLDKNINIAFLFKFSEIKPPKRKTKFNYENFIPKSNKKSIFFYLKELRYIRAYIVRRKSGKTIISQDKEEHNYLVINNNKFGLKKSYKSRKSKISEEEFSESSEKNKRNILTAEKILELKVHNFIEIQNFIYSLPIYGVDVSLERFRPNGDKYSASKITEPNIKIHLNDFCKRIAEIAPLDPKFKKTKLVNINHNNTQKESLKSSSTSENYFLSANESSYNESYQAVSISQGEEINKGLSSNSSSSLSNIFKNNTIFYIKILINLTFLGTFLLIVIEFLITFRHMNKLKEKIQHLKNSFKILDDIVYAKYFVTEGVIGNALSFRYFPYIMLSKTYFKDISNNLGIIRQEFTEIYNTFSSNELCKEFKDFMGTKINIFTLTITIPEKLPLLFNNAMTRISSSINNLVSDPSLMKMDKRDTYELMHNLINEYYINWLKAVNILYKDSINYTKFKIPLLIIVILYFIISIIILLVFLQLLAKFSLERKKPIDLFLTIKKVIFENLKNSAENFSNKLLNKFFGNEDEEDQQNEYQANIQPKDINIAKFKAANESASSIDKALEFYIIILIIVFFLILNLIYFLVKYINFRAKMRNIEQFIVLFERINKAENDIVLSVDIYKSFLFNKSIPILNNSKTTSIFFETFINLSNKFEDSIIYITKTKSFLSGDYLKKYEKYYLGDFRELVNQDYYEKNKERIKDYITHGIKPVAEWLFGIIKYHAIIYSITNNPNVQLDTPSELLMEMEFRVYKTNLMTEIFNKDWYNGVIKLMIESYYDYHNKGKINYIIFFISLIIIVIFYYTIIWKICEKKLNLLLKRSADLINLIPHEIKNIIIEKLNE